MTQTRKPEEGGGEQVGEDTTATPTVKPVEITRSTDRRFRELERVQFDALDRDLDRDLDRTGFDGT